MSDISIQVWWWLASSIAVTVLGLLAIRNGIRDLQSIDGEDAPEGALRRIARRNLRNGVIVFTIGSLAGSLALMFIIGRLTDDAILLRRFGNWLPWALNLILALLGTLILIEQYDRWRLLNPDQSVWPWDKR